MIDVYKLTAEDRGRIVKVREEELGSYHLGVVWRSPR